VRILVIFNDYLQTGGERISVATEIGALKEAGIDVRLVSIDNHSLDSASSLGKAKRTFPNQDMDELVSREIADFRPDLVHAENLFPQLGAGAISAIRRSGLPWVRTIRNYRKGCIAGTFTRAGKPCTDCSGSLGRIPGIIHGCYQGGVLASVGATNYALWDSRAEHDYAPSAYILISRAMQQEIASSLQTGPVQHVVHNAAEASPKSTRAAMSDRQFDVAYVGRLANEKGLEIAMSMARLLPQRSFVFAGSGHLEAAVELLASENSNVTFVKDLDPQGVSSLMQQSRVVVVPSIWDEPFGRVAAEALAAGALPVVSDRGGLPEIVQGLAFKCVVSSADSIEWSKTVDSLLDLGPSALDAHSTAAIQHWSEKFSPKALAGRLIDVYEEVLDRR
jgi:glycosyltransferase involved in cell wall biosynthesis